MTSDAYVTNTDCAPTLMFGTERVNTSRLSKETYALITLTAETANTDVDRTNDQSPSQWCEIK